jgi:hypothetical protein
MHHGAGLPPAPLTTRALAIPAPAAHLRTMPSKPTELPREVALAFARDMRAFFKAKDQLKLDEIAAGTGWMLQQHLPHGTKLRLSDVKALFLQMREHQ